LACEEVRDRNYGESKQCDIPIPIVTIFVVYGVMGTRSDAITVIV